MRKSLTFAVVDERRRRASLCWRFIADGSDLYFGPGLCFAAPEPSRYKASLHASRRCHWAFDAHYFEDHGRDRLKIPSRKTNEWIRPETPTDVAGISVFEIYVLPTTEDRFLAPDEDLFSMTFPPPRVGFSVLLHVVYSLRTPTEFKASNAAVLGHHRLDSGEYVYFAAREIPLNPKEIPLPTQVGEAAWLDPKADPPSPNPVRAILFFENQPNSPPRVIDLPAVQTENGAEALLIT